MPAYVMVNADSNVPWPAEQMTVSFGGCEILLVPPRYENARMTAYPLAAIEYKRGEDQRALVNVIRRFFNALVWQHQRYIREVEVHYGAPLREGTRISGNSTTDRFDASSLVDPNDSEARIALAFYHEGLALKRFDIAYSFLSLFKVLNIRLGAGPPQKGWINAHATQLRNTDAVSRLTELQQTEPDVGAYYTSRAAAQSRMRSALRWWILTISAISNACHVIGH